MTASADLLFNLRNSFYLGAYQAAINSSDIPNLPADDALERDVIVHRSYIALGSYQVVSTFPIAALFLCICFCSCDFLSVSETLTAFLGPCSLSSMRSIRRIQLLSKLLNCSPFTYLEARFDFSFLFCYVEIRC